MRYKRIIVFILCLLGCFAAITKPWSCIYVHGKLATITENSCVRLPKPPYKCNQKVDWSSLYGELKNGAAEPDSTDGVSSPKHSFNVGYPIDHSWDFAIRKKLDLPEGAVINAGNALNAIANEKEIIKYQLSTINCRSDIEDYAYLWKRFGRLSHYCADIAIPLHSYSVGINGEYCYLQL